jgi:microcystin-dependent protein
VLGGTGTNAVKVGIGTSSPTELLTLTGISGTDGILFPDSTLQTTAFTGNVTSNEITDADSDTKIQVEESGNENKIRFDIGGVEYFRMDTGRLEVLNSGGSVFIGQNAGSEDDLSNNDNVFVGHESGRVNTTGNKNTASGARSFRSNITGSANVASGYESLSNNTGSSNTGVGAWALSSNSSGENNASFGRGANSANTIGNNNLAIGSYALGINVSGSKNVAIGNGALDFINGSPVKNTAIGYEAGFNAAGSNNVFIGHQAGKNKADSHRLYIDNTSTATPLIYGEFDNKLLQINGTLNINNAFSLPTVDGSADQILKTDGGGNLTWINNSAGTPAIDTLSLIGSTLKISLENDGQPALNLDLSSLAPVGTIQMWPTATPPTGWLICNGSTFSAATYPTLNTVLGDAQVPNFEGRFPLGAKPIPVPQGETIFPLNSTGGEEKHILTVAEMPSHSHGIEYREGSESGSNNNYSDLGDTGVNDSTQNTGGGQAHNNMPPYLAIHFIIKAN